MTTEKQVTPERDLGLLECRGLAVLYVDPSSTITCLTYLRARTSLSHTRETGQLTSSPQSQPKYHLLWEAFLDILHLTSNPVLFLF